MNIKITFLNISDVVHKINLITPHLQWIIFYVKMKTYNQLINDSCDLLN